MSKVIITALAVLANSDDILLAHPVFELRKKVAVIADLQPNISVETETRITSKMRIYLEPTFADLMELIGHDVYELSMDTSAEDDEEEEEAPKKRGKKAEKEVEEATPSLRYIEYDCGIEHLSKNLKDISDTPEWKKLFPKNEDMLMNKLAQLTVAVAGATQPLTDASAQLEETGMADNPAAFNQNTEVMRHLLMTRMAEQERHRENAMRIYSFFETKVLKVPEEDEEVEIQELTAKELEEYLSEDDEAREEYLTKIQEELLTVLTPA